ncbi:MAG: hypothetical protein AAGC74_09135 [Verrucomicrobiota bacterium]
MSDFIQTLLGNLLATGGLLAASIYIFKQSFERLLDKRVEAYKGQLAEDLEHLKANLAAGLEQVKLASAKNLELLRSDKRAEENAKDAEFRTLLEHLKAELAASLEQVRLASAKNLEHLKSEKRTEENTKDARFRSLLEFRGKQLRDFYWPLYLGLQKDNVMWRRILDKRDSNNELKKNVGAVIERDVVLPNHSELVRLIESNLYLAEADKELEQLLLGYIRHVSLYQAIRTAGEEMIFPLKLGEEWPHDLFPRIKERTHILQAEYDAMLKNQEREAGVTPTH